MACCIFKKLKQLLSKDKEQELIDQLGEWTIEDIERLEQVLWTIRKDKENE